MYLLYIEDDPREVDLLRLALARSGSPLALVVVPDEARALDHLLRRGEAADRPGGNPVIIFLALELDGQHGPDLIAQIRQHPSLAFIPIAMLTATRDPQDVAECYRRGANAYVVKSLDFGRFVDDLGSTLRFWSSVCVPNPQ